MRTSPMHLLIAIGALLSSGTVLSAGERTTILAQRHLADRRERRGDRCSQDVWPYRSGAGISEAGQARVSRRGRPFGNAELLLVSEIVCRAGQARNRHSEDRQVEFGTAVWLNGKPVGEHLSCWTAGYFNVTDAMNWSGPNRLVIRVGPSRPSARKHSWLRYGRFKQASASGNLGRREPDVLRQSAARDDSGGAARQCCGSRGAGEGAELRPSPELRAESCDQDLERREGSLGRTAE